MGIQTTEYRPDQLFVSTATTAEKLLPDETIFKNSYKTQSFERQSYQVLL